jgi:hypothetical protein
VRLVEEALLLWRAADDVLATMPPTHPDRPDVAWIAQELRRLTCRISTVESSSSSAATTRQSLGDLKDRLSRAVRGSVSGSASPNRR